MKSSFSYTGVSRYLTPIVSLLLLSQAVAAQARTVGGIATIGDLNSPGVGGIVVSIKADPSSAVVSDNDGEYRIDVSGDDAVLVFSYPGMITQEIAVGERSKLDVDLVKIASEPSQTVYATSLGIVLGEKASDVEKNVAAVLKERLQKNSRVAVSVSDEPDSSANLNIYLGLEHRSDRLEQLCENHNIVVPGRDGPAPEGYAVKMVTLDNAPAIVAVGDDNRGVLYAAGEILRQMKVEPLGVRFTTFDVGTAPAYRFRGAHANQGGTMRKYTGARAWTTDETKQALLDHALAGANCFYAGWNGGEMYDFLKSFDLMTAVGIRPNKFLGEHPEEWKSSGLSDWEWNGNNWICPNIPEARKALLEQWSERFENMADHDVLRFYAGDPGGCRDERCNPWGNTFVRLCEEISNIALKKNPDLAVLIANQDLSNEGDRAIFDYLSEEPRKWLYGLAYGPGSNAMSWYFRHKLNDDLFEYPGYGWLNRYLAETLNSIPRDQKIVHYSDITHWTMAQYNVENPERNLVKSFGRRTWHTRPLALHKISWAIMPFSQGDIIYTEGYHDHFNQYLWQRLLWNPHLAAEEVVAEYCRLYFGEGAADLMAEAIFQLEKNLVVPLAENDGIDRYYALLKESEAAIPEHLMEGNHIWRLFMQKAALDKYVQLKLRRELFKEERVRRFLRQGLETGDLNTAIDQSLLVLSEPAQTPTMEKYRKEADRLGIETERLFGVRNVGYFKLDQNLRELPDLLETLKKAKTASSEQEKRESLAQAIQNTRKKTDYGRVHW